MSGFNFFRYLSKFLYTYDKSNSTELIYLFQFFEIYILLLVDIFTFPFKGVKLTT